MKIIPADVDGFKQALIALENGEVVVHATETCYGMACDLRNPKAVAKLFAIKKRDHAQPVSALFASVEDAKEYVEWTDRAEELAKDGLPGPLTLILLMKAGAPAKLYPTPDGSSLSIGVRVSSLPLASSLALEFGAPISTTSANVHGHPPAYSVHDLQHQFTGGLAPDLILDSGTLPKNPPSRIIDLTQEKPKTLRK